MSSSADLNIVLGQGSAVKEVHNVRKQHLELNQGFVQQKTEEMRNSKRTSVRQFDNKNKVENKKKKKQEHRKQGQENTEAAFEGKNQDDPDSLKGSLIDIRV